MPSQLPWRLGTVSVPPSQFRTLSDRSEAHHTLFSRSHSKPFLSRITVTSGTQHSPRGTPFRSFSSTDHTLTSVLCLDWLAHLSTRDFFRHSIAALHRLSRSSSTPIKSYDLCTHHNQSGTAAWWKKRKSIYTQTNRSLRLTSLRLPSSASPSYRSSRAPPCSAIFEAASRKA